jgi:hypothetical protein
MSARMEFLSADIEFMLEEPEILSWQLSNVAPAVGETITITAAFNGAQAAWLGKRNSAATKFVRIPMMDDGLHEDGAAGDGIYGAQVTLSGDSIQFYFYAENNEAGIFSPARAEHEFHSVFAAGVSVEEAQHDEFGFAYPNPTSGELYIPMVAGSTEIVSVYDNVGSLVLTDSIFTASPVLHMNDLADGCYVVVWNQHHQRIQLIH